MCGVVALISIVAGIDAGIVIKERLISPSIVTLSAVDRANALETGIITGCAKILDLIACCIEEESCVILESGLGTGEIAEVVLWITIVDHGGVACITDETVGGGCAVETTSLAITCKEDDISNLDIPQIAAGPVCRMINPTTISVGSASCITKTTTSIGITTIAVARR